MPPPTRIRPFDYPLLVVACGFGTGFLRPFAGTWGSIPPLLAGWWLAVSSPAWVFSSVTAAGILAAVTCAHRAQRYWGHDAKRITIDEFAGMLVTLMGLPPVWWVWVAAFFAFRFFDVLKPPPVRQLERLPGGAGVVADDIAAGIYANLAMRLVLFFIS